MGVCIHAECLISRSICLSVRPSAHRLSVCSSNRPSLCIKQSYNNSKNADKILNRVVFLKFFDVFIFCLKSDKSKGHFVSQTSCFSSPISRRTREIFIRERRILSFSHAQQQSTHSIPVLLAA
jgi:hypothetical protein